MQCFSLFLSVSASPISLAVSSFPNGHPDCLPCLFLSPPALSLTDQQSFDATIAKIYIGLNNPLRKTLTAKWGYEDAVP